MQRRSRERDVLFLVGAGKQNATLRRLAAEYTHAILVDSVEGDATDGSLGGLLDCHLGLGGAIPMCKDEATLILEHILIALSSSSVLIPMAPLGWAWGIGSTRESLGLGLRKLRLESEQVPS